jgi:hypothetical protein
MILLRNYTNKEILEHVESLPTFTGWKIGVYDIWIRNISDNPNVFDDKVYTFECTSNGIKPKFIMVCTGTSNAGLTGLKEFKKYNSEGCGVLKSDIVVYDSHKYGLHKGKYPAYTQNKPYPYYRDNNLNDKAEEIGTIHNNIIGANCHHAGVNSTFINDWSLACLVRNVLKQFDAWMKFMNKRPLTVIILKSF